MKNIYINKLRMCNSEWQDTSPEMFEDCWGRIWGVFLLCELKEGCSFISQILIIYISCVKLDAMDQISFKNKYGTCFLWNFIPNPNKT
jgi:hypothetical protein